MNWISRRVVISIEGMLRGFLAGLGDGVGVSTVCACADVGVGTGPGGCWY